MTETTSITLKKYLKLLLLSKYYLKKINDKYGNIINLINDAIQNEIGQVTVDTVLKKEAFVGDKRKFNLPVLVELAPGVFKPGFITQQDLKQLVMN